MDYDETAKVLGVIKLAYPKYYKDMKPSDARGTVALWQQILGEYPKEVVESVVKAYIAQDNQFPPSVGHINAQIKKLTEPQLMTPQEAWALVAKAVDYYHYDRNFRELPEDIQKVIGDSKQLQDWALIDNPASWQVVASNFQKSYGLHQVRKKEEMLIPQVIRDQLQGLKMLGNGND